VFDLSGKTVVVTGGGTGIGKGIARAMVQSGARVVISGRRPAPLQETTSELNVQGERVVPVVADITDKEDIDRIVSTALSVGGGRLDCWVNNAGSADASDVGPLIELTEKQWDAVVDVNLKWTFFAAQAAARAMHHGGSIVNLSSRSAAQRSASQPNPITGHYGAAKAGVESLTATMAVEWGHLGIRVNAVAPGVVVTERNGGPGGSLAGGNRRARQEATIPLSRLGEVDDIGPLCVYFAADESSWTTGSVVQVHGGSRLPIGYLTYLHRFNKVTADPAEPEGGLGPAVVPEEGSEQ
jgi:NAD(P)-dependent dehydrogenase (short-subunit alcohol dehydrogenase family)